MILNITTMNTSRRLKIEYIKIMSNKFKIEMTQVADRA